MSVRELARRANCSKSHIWDLEQGNRQPTPGVARALDAAVGAGCTLISLAEATDKPGASNPPEAVTAGGRARVYGDLSSPLPVAGQEESRPALSADECGQDQRAREAGANGDEALVLAAAEESAWHGRLLGGTNTDDGELDRLDGQLDRAAIDLMTGSLMPLMLDLRRLRDEAFAALDGRQYPRQARRLYAVGARACGLLAVAAADRFGRYAAAATHSHLAAAAAGHAEDPVLVAWVASLHSTIAFWQGRYRSAAAIARQARAAMPGGVEAARLASFEARAWAKLGDRESMEAALASAEASREQDGPAAGPGVIEYPLSNQIRISGTAHLWIGDHTRARAELAEALRLLAAEYDSLPHIAAARADLALAHLQADALDDAAEVLAPLLAMTGSGAHLVGAARRAGELTRALRSLPVADSGLARRLLTEIDSFVNAQTSTHDDAPRLPPAPPGGALTR
jgi:transcriptional regulator with XRE-family HTH domain